MPDLTAWLNGLPGHRFVQLFETDNDLVVQTKLSGPNQRRLLKRSPEMEAAVISMVEDGLRDDRWEGLLYVMGTGQAEEFRPLYVGKAERRGVKNELSANITSIKTNSHMFARWGDGVAYHIGDLSHVLFDFKAYRPPTRKYRRWAEALFASFDPPRLRVPVSLYLAPWLTGAAGPSGLIGSLPAAEKEVIALASALYGKGLLNADGV